MGGTISMSILLQFVVVISAFVLVLLVDILFKISNAKELRKFNEMHGEVKPCENCPYKIMKEADEKIDMLNNELLDLKNKIHKAAGDEAKENDAKQAAYELCLAKFHEEQKKKNVLRYNITDNDFNSSESKAKILITNVCEFFDSYYRNLNTYRRNCIPLILLVAGNYSAIRRFCITLRDDEETRKLVEKALDEDEHFKEKLIEIMNVFDIEHLTPFDRMNWERGINSKKNSKIAVKYLIILCQQLNLYYRHFTDVVFNYFGYEYIIPISAKKKIAVYDVETGKEITVDDIEEDE